MFCCTLSYHTMRTTACGLSTSDKTVWWLLKVLLSYLILICVTFLQRVGWLELEPMGVFWYVMLAPRPKLIRVLYGKRCVDVGWDGWFDRAFLRTCNQRRGEGRSFWNWRMCLMSTGRHWNASRLFSTCIGTLLVYLSVMCLLDFGVNLQCLGFQLIGTE